MNNIEKFQDALIGCQLIKLDDEHMIVKTPSGELIPFEFTLYHGDCCGYAEITNTLLYASSDKNNPVITKVERDEDSDGYSETVVLTLFGIDKDLATVKTTCGSGSGWCYGATVSVQCKPLNICETICEW